MRNLKSTVIALGFSVLSANTLAQGISPSHIKVIATGDKVLIKFEVLNLNTYKQQYTLSVDGKFIGVLAPMRGKSEKKIKLTLKAKRDSITVRKICITPKKNKHSKIIIPVCVRATITSASYLRKGKEQ